MITARNALEVLVASGFATSYSRHTENEYGHRVTEFRVESDRFNVGNETYGKESFLYFRCVSADVAWQMIEALKKAGAKPGTGWNGGPDNGRFDLRVGYFKGRRWWE